VVKRQVERRLMLLEILNIPVAPIHLKAVEHSAWIEATKRRRSLMLGFRGLGKTTTITVPEALGQMLANPDIRILFASDTEPAAMAFHSETAGHLQKNDTLIELFGRFYPLAKAIDKKSSTVMQREKVYREPTFFAVGIGGQLASWHFDFIIADDVITLRNSQTPRRRDNVRAWHDSTLLGAVTPKTTILYHGTRYYPNDLYDDLQHGREDEETGTLADATLILPMVENYDDPRDEWIPTNPERYPKELCIQTSIDMGRYHFGAQMQQDTRAGEGIIFNYATFRWYGQSELPPRDEMAVYCGFDLAAKRTETRAFFAATAVGVHQHSKQETRIYVLDHIRKRLGMAGQRDACIEFTRKWQPVDAVIEAIAMQAGFAQELIEGTILPFRPLEHMEGDKEMRARRVSPLTDNGQVWFPMDTVQSGDTPELIQELTQFPDSPFKDSTDSFVHAVTAAMFPESQAAAAAPAED
jgi:predicted phage terminase large subunit-like protein